MLSGLLKRLIGYINYELFFLWGCWHSGGREGLGEVQNRKSLDFRSPVVGISVNSQYHQCTFGSDWINFCLLILNSFWEIFPTKQNTNNLHSQAQLEILPSQPLLCTPWSLHKYCLLQLVECRVQYTQHLLHS